MGDDVSGKLQLNHGGDPGDVQSTARQVGANQYRNRIIFDSIIAALRVPPEAIQVLRSLVQRNLGVVRNRIDPAINQRLVNRLHVADAVQKDHGFFSLQSVVAVAIIGYGQQHFGQSLHSFFFGFDLVPLGGLGQSVVLGVVHVPRFDSFGIGKPFLQIGIDALQSHVRKRGRAKDVLGLLNGLIIVGIGIWIDQPVGPTEPNQDVFQRPNVSAV
mmetsp:Transcript_27590/g.60750  ORF Transcript_27590/g.60750 Transcript_27590/m.60750 type:complete len:215 (-) Transcript_27590:1411-2055(-)